MKIYVKKIYKKNMKNIYKIKKNITEKYTNLNVRL